MSEDRLRGALRDVISNFTVTLGEKSITLQGASRTYYNKIRATEEARKFFPARTIHNEIEVK